jgi:hypothetical protein
MRLLPKSQATAMRRWSAEVEYFGVVEAAKERPEIPPCRGSKGLGKSFSAVQGQNNTKYCHAMTCPDLLPRDL